MTLTSGEQRFISQNKEVLRALVAKRMDDLKDKVFQIEAGEARDKAISFIKELEYWLSVASLVERTERNKKPGNKNAV